MKVGSLASAFLVLFLSGCFLRGSDKLPFNLESGLLPLSQCHLAIPAPPKSFTRLYRVKTEYDGKRASMRMLVQYVAPQRLRIDLMPPSGSFYLLSRIELNGTSGEFTDYGQKIHVVGESKDLLKEILGVALDVESAASVLDGGVPLSRQQIVDLQCTPDKKFITLKDGSAYGTTTAAPQHFFLRSGSRLKFAVISYRSKKGRIPEKIELSQMPDGLFVTVVPVPSSVR
jgi:outer membrane biogenesis lipoprotein LolB